MSDISVKFTSDNFVQQKATDKNNKKNIEKKGADPKKIALAIGAMASVGIAGICIAKKIRNGKLDLSKSQENIKKFFDKDGNEISDIVLKNGKAVEKEGLPFTGIMETVTKSGKKVKLDYEAGLLKQSSINDKLFKTYEITDKSARSRMIEISRFNEAGEKFSTVHNYEVKDGVQKLKSKFEKLSNGKIKMSFFENNKCNDVELPEYLYHVTSKTKMASILNSNSLRKSATEQLPGIYLLDSENFIANYATTPVRDGSKDLLTSIFRQANSKNYEFNNGELSIIKIPTEELLKNGKLRVRTQEDYFKFSEVIKDMSDIIGKKFTLRGLADDKTRAEFYKEALSKNIMTKDELDNFFDQMAKKIHQGYKLNELSSHSDFAKKSVEYIYNNNIPLDKFKNVQVQDLSLEPLRNKEPLTVDFVKSIFNSDFKPYSN